MARFIIVFLALVAIALASEVRRREYYFLRAQRAERCRERFQANLEDVAPGLASRIAPLSKKLDALRRKLCGDGDALELEKEFHVAVEKEAERMGLQPSPYNLTILEPLEGPAEAVVIVLHGVFGTAEMELQVAEALRERIPRTRFIVPQANNMYVTFFNRTGPSWFDLLSNNPDGPQDVAGTIQAADNIKAILDIQRKVLGIAEDRVAVYGTSQGAGLALTVYLRHVVAAVVSVAGFLPVLDTYPAALNPDSQSAPALMFHGTDDELVPFFVGELSRDAIRAFGRMVEFVVFGGEPHNLSSRNFEMWEKAGQLFKKVLGFI